MRFLETQFQIIPKNNILSTIIYLNGSFCYLNTIKYTNGMLTLIQIISNYIIGDPAGTRTPNYGSEDRRDYPFHHRTNTNNSYIMFFYVMES